MADFAVASEVEVEGGGEACPLTDCLATPSFVPPTTTAFSTAPSDFDFLGEGCEGDGRFPTLVGKDRSLGVRGSTKVPPSFAPSLGTQSGVGHESRLESSTASRRSETQCGPHTASWVRVAKGDSRPPTAVG